MSWKNTEQTSLDINITVPIQKLRMGSRNMSWRNVNPVKFVTEIQAPSLLKVTHVLLEQAGCAQRELDLRRFFLKWKPRREAASGCTNNEWQPQLRHDKSMHRGPPHCCQTHQLELSPAELPWMIMRLLHSLTVNMRFKKKNAVGPKMTAGLANFESNKKNSHQRRPAEDERNSRWKGPIDSAFVSPGCTSRKFVSR